jgi:hypothetical protein
MCPIAGARCLERQDVLTLDLVRAYRRGDELKLRSLDKETRERARNLATEYIQAAKASVGRTRKELEASLAAVPSHARDRKLAAGLRKLVLDRCEVESESACDPIELRRQVFEHASKLRQQLEPGASFDRDAVLATIAGERAMEVSELERLLYVDLRGAHRVRAFASLDADGLVELYADGQAQAVLLRAVRVRARVFATAPAVYRALFRKLKFLRLMHVIEPATIDDEPGGYDIAIDGPYSLFRSVTQYGLQLALMLPALRACDRWSLEAEVLWGKQRQPLRFALASQRGQAASATDQLQEPHLPDEVAALRDRFEERFVAGKSKWRARPCSDILDLPGVGLCVPDLELVHDDTGECVYFEALGYWSRQAVWRRVELIEQGLPHRIVFAVSSRLRVSEAALDRDLPGALYVYKGVMSPRAVEQRLDALCGESATRD